MGKIITSEAAKTKKKFSQLHLKHLLMFLQFLILDYTRGKKKEPTTGEKRSANALQKNGLNDTHNIKSF